MTKKEVIEVRGVLLRIKDPDGYVKTAISICDKQIATFEKYKGQLKEMYESDNDYFSFGGR